MSVIDNAAAEAVFAKSAIIKPDEVKEAPRVVIRRYVMREIGGFDAWELALAGRLYPQMWESKRALLLMLKLLDALEDNPKIVEALSRAMRTAGKTMVATSRGPSKQ